MPFKRKGKRDSLLYPKTVIVIPNAGVDLMNTAARRERKTLLTRASINIRKFIRRKMRGMVAFWLLSSVLMPLSFQSAFAVDVKLQALTTSGISSPIGIDYYEPNNTV